MDLASVHSMSKFPVGVVVAVVMASLVVAENPS